MKRYWVLQIFSWVLMIAAVVIWVTTIISMIDYAQRGAPAVDELTGLINELSALFGSQLGRFTQDMTQGLIWRAFVERMFIGMAFLAGGQFIDMLRDMAGDLRRMRMYEDRDFLIEKRPDQWR